MSTPARTLNTASHPTSTFVHGPVLMMGANLMFGLVPIFVRYATSAGVPSAQVTFVRFAVGALAVVGFWMVGGRLNPQNWKYLILRGVFGGLAVSTYFFAVQETTAAKGTLLNFTHSLWANVYAVFFFSARPPRGFWWILAMAAVGLWLVLDPHFATFNRGDAVGIFSGMMGGAAVMSVKRLRDTDSSWSIFAAFSFIGMLFALIPGFFQPAGAAPFTNWLIPASGALLALLGVGLTGMGGQLVFTYAYRYTSIPLGSVMALSVPALAAVFGLVFLGEPLTPHFLLGGTLILTACGLLQLRERRELAEAEAARMAGPSSATPSPRPADDRAS